MINKSHDFDELDDEIKMISLVNKENGDSNDNKNSLFRISTGNKKIIRKNLLLTNFLEKKIEILNWYGRIMEENVDNIIDKYGFLKQGKDIIVHTIPSLSRSVSNTCAYYGLFDINQSPSFRKTPMLLKNVKNVSCRLFSWGKENHWHLWGTYWLIVKWPLDHIIEATPYDIGRESSRGLWHIDNIIYPHWYIRENSFNEIKFQWWGAIPKALYVEVDENGEMLIDEYTLNCFSSSWLPIIKINSSNKIESLGKDSISCSEGEDAFFFTQKTWKNTNKIIIYKHDKRRSQFYIEESGELLSRKQVLWMQDVFREKVKWDQEDEKLVSKIPNIYDNLFKIEYENSWKLKGINITQTFDSYWWNQVNYFLSFGENTVVGNAMVKPKHFRYDMEYFSPKGHPWEEEYEQRTIKEKEQTHHYPIVFRGISSLEYERILFALRRKLSPQEQDKFSKELGLIEKQVKCPVMTDYIEPQQLLTELKNVIEKYNEDKATDPIPLLNLLKKIYPNEYKKSVVWQGYTLEEHTLMVMQQFEKYFSGISLPCGISKNVFRLSLALHDIWKPKALLEGNIGLQHKYSILEIKDLFEKLNIDKNQSKVILSLISKDPIGMFLKGSIDSEEAWKEIKHMAKEANVSVHSFFNLLCIYYKVDASSYTEDSGCCRSLDHLFDTGKDENTSLVFSDQVEEKISRLRDSISVDVW